MSAGKKRGKLGRSTRAPKAAQGIERADLWNYARAARYIGIAEKTLQAWVERGIYAVPHIRLGRLIRFRRTSIERWLETREGNHFAPAPAAEGLDAR